MAQSQQVKPFLRPEDPQLLENYRLMQELEEKAKRQTDEQYILGMTSNGKCGIYFPSLASHTQRSIKSDNDIPVPTTMEGPIERQRSVDRMNLPPVEHLIGFEKKKWKQAKRMVTEKETRKLRDRKITALDGNHGERLEMPRKGYQRNGNLSADTSTAFYLRDPIRDSRHNF